ncbi:MAG TPA: hypothetical protein PLM09_18215, partial [Casimicrobiaceae bacterium]|nr:hypothetical protein [Casimicrobiaceae bacterium]
RSSAAIRRELVERFGERGAAVEVITFSASARTGLAEADAVLARWLAA